MPINAINIIQMGAEDDPETLVCGGTYFFMEW